MVFAGYLILERLHPLMQARMNLQAKFSELQSYKMVSEPISF